jgi:type I restriction-modification system DNA methylase subunit
MQQINAGATDEAKFKEVHAALANYLRPPDPEVLRKRKIKELEAKLIGQKIDGFFPTPRPVIELMLQHADIRAGHSVLEPSCGKGDIAEVIMEKYPDIYHLHLVEWNYQLIEICRAKGMYPAQLDFLDYEQKVDRIVMNPPFEHGQDIDHIRHAYDLLNPEGRMVTIVSEGPFFRQGKKEEDFRYWIYELGYLAHEIQLGAGAFTGKESFRQTGIATRILIIEKDE